MKIKDAMQNGARICRAEDNLMNAAEMMRRENCGVLCVADADGNFLGLLDEREICVAVAARNRKASAVTIGEVNLTKTPVCAAANDLEDAVRKMRKYKIETLAVVCKAGEIVGSVSIFDALLAVHKNKKLQKRIYATLKAIHKPRPIILREITADNPPINPS